MPPSNHPLRPGGVYVIAEAGVNHNGDSALARALIDVAARAGADAVKFQMFDADEITSEAAPLAEYQEQSGESGGQKNMLRRLALPREDFRMLKSHAEEKGLTFITTPFDAVSAEFLATLGVRILKIPSGEITNIPFLQRVAALHIFTIISTGMSTVEEIRQAVQPFVDRGVPYALLHCVSAYPTPPDQINLKAMETLRRAFPVPIGFSDHTQGIDIPVMAAALGAEIIEKHFTLDRTMAGPDHAASLEPDELAEMIRRIRDTADLGTITIPPEVLGDGVKRCQSCEENTRAVARRSIVASAEIPAGAVITPTMLSIKRPGTGIAPKNMSSVIGKTAKARIAAGVVLIADMLQ